MLSNSFFLLSLTHLGEDKKISREFPSGQMRRNQEMENSVVDPLTKSYSHEVVNHDTFLENKIKYTIYIWHKNEDLPKT